MIVCCFVVVIHFTKGVEIPKEPHCLLIRCIKKKSGFEDNCEKLPFVHSPIQNVFQVRSAKPSRDMSHVRRWTTQDTVYEIIYTLKSLWTGSFRFRISSISAITHSYIERQTKKGVFCHVRALRALLFLNVWSFLPLILHSFECSHVSSDYRAAIERKPSIKEEPGDSWGINRVPACFCSRMLSFVLVYLVMHTDDLIVFES